LGEIERWERINKRDLNLKFYLSCEGFLGAFFVAFLSRAVRPA
jgi:hypothetical protein